MNFDMNEIKRLRLVIQEINKLKDDVENLLNEYSDFINGRLRKTKIGSTYTYLMCRDLEIELVKLFNGVGYDIDTEKAYITVSDVLSSNFIDYEIMQGGVDNKIINVSNLRIHIDSLISDGI